VRLTSIGRWVKTFFLNYFKFLISAKQARPLQEQGQAAACQGLPLQRREETCRLNLTAGANPTIFEFTATTPAF
jgi:hypothetical protein